MVNTITDVVALESCVGKVPGARDLKVIDYLDEGALRWIAASTFLFAAFGDGGEPGITVGGGEPGFVEVIDATHLKLSGATLDEPRLAHVGQGAGTLFLTPNIGETLRVNGRVRAVSDGAIEIAVEECYLHCAKALIRSDFWNAAPCSDAPDGAEEFLAASRFIALATINARGQADISPKGDPSGAMLRVQNGSIRYADRPGNRRVDSFRNILEQPHIAAAALIPGSARIATLSGVARITTDVEICSSFAVEGKTPRITTCIEQFRLNLRDSDALVRARLWPSAPRAEGIDPAAIFAAHAKHSKAGGLQARLMRTVLTPGLIEKALQRDYKRKLY
jgi:predicted pyridoxine 5'-phosphate oxidase superfamily flavin-nucleotide-binding protein